MNCLDEERLFALVEGAASEKDARLWQQHVDGCERCRKALGTMQKAVAAIAEEEPLDVKAHADAVMGALDRPPAKRQRVLVPLAVSGLALAAALLLGIGIGRTTKPEDPGEFTARGGGSVSSLGHDVAVDVLERTPAGTYERLTENAQITSNVSFTARFRNLGPASSYALVFLVDANRDVLWLYPAFVDPRSNPTAVALAPAKELEPLGDGVSFRDIAAGRATLVTVLTKTPLSVSDVEKRDDPSPEALRKAFPEADVRALTIQVRP